MLSGAAARRGASLLDRVLSPTALVLAGAYLALVALYVEALDDHALHRRDRAHTAVALDRGDRSRDSPRRRARPRLPRVVALHDRTVVVDPRRRHGVCGDQADRSRVHDFGALPDVCARAGRAGKRLGSRRGNRGRGDAGACVLPVPRAGTAHLPARDAGAAPDREAALTPVAAAGYRCARRGDSGRPRAIPASRPASCAGAHLSRARLGRGGGSSLASLVEPGRLVRRRSARPRRSGGYRHSHQPSLTRLVSDHDLLQAPDLRLRDLGSRGVHDRNRPPSGDRRDRGAGPASHVA